MPNITVETIESVKKAQQFITRTMVDGDPNTHKALVCVICDAMVIGTERVCYLSKEKILKHGHRLGVQRYKENFGVTLDPLLV